MMDCRSRVLIPYTFTVVFIGFVAGYRVGHHDGRPTPKLIELSDLTCDKVHNTISIRTGDYLGSIMDAVDLCDMQRCPSTCQFLPNGSTFYGESVTAYAERMK